MITVGIPTLNRYDLLQKCVESAMQGTLKPDKILIVDNGGRIDEMGCVFPPEANIEIYRPGFNTGCAGGWNFIIKNTEDKRIIVNDDIQFCPNTIELMVDKLNKGAHFVWVCKPYGTLNGFSCFAVADKLVKEIGYFDEEISPGYAYFEDNDYHARMALAGITEVDSEAEAIHATSSTLAAFTPEQQRDHHRRFELAQRNYLRKWRALPGHEPALGLS
jgi:GT2 family glycosyltransferase